MSHFTFESDLNSALREAPLTRGPLMRWQKKISDKSSSMSSSINVSQTGMNASLTGKPQPKTPSKNNLSLLGVGKKTPKSASKRTPNASRTPKTPGGDRFIPVRCGNNGEMASFLIMQKEYENKNPNAEVTESPGKLMHAKRLKEELQGDTDNYRILKYSKPPPSAPEGSQNAMKVLYSSSKSVATGAKKSMRHIPSMPDRILDAPEIVNDYYLNLIDWSKANILAVALSSHLYLWNAESGDINQLLDLPGGSVITSVSYASEGNYLAVGTSNSEVQIWDVSANKRLRIMKSHASRVAAMSWNQHLLSSGCRSGLIHHHDVRVAQHHIATLNGHTQEICGLKWSPDGKYLASGGNDNQLCIWPNVVGINLEPRHSEALYTFTDHCAAVKALAWCPWKPSMLASGGGTADRCIRLWNCNTGSLLNSVTTNSQVCGLLWSSEYKELISGHGYSNHQLTLWKYPEMTKVDELYGHNDRILAMALSPDGTTVISASADETLRLWRCWDVDPVVRKNQEKKKLQAQTTESGRNIKKLSMMR